MNMGYAPVRNMVIQYGTKGFPKKLFRWNGNLASGESVFISLPGSIDGKPGINEFEAVLLKPNGREDGYPDDNKLVSLFNAAPVHDSLMVVYLQTNNQPEQNGYVIRNSNKQIVKQRMIGSLLPQTVYRDTIILADGKYEFELIDTADNGLEFWANPKGGRGKLRLLNGNGQLVADFESDFGNSLFYAFEVSKPASPVLPLTSIGLYPTRTNDKTTLDYYSNFPQDVRVLITSDPDGEIAEEHHYPNIKEGEFTYDLSRFPKSRYFLSVRVNGEEKFKKRIRLKE
jgi:hypothetical protein